MEEVQQEVEDGKVLIERERENHNHLTLLQKDLLAAQEETHRISEERDSLLVCDSYGIFWNDLVDSIKGQRHHVHEERCWTPRDFRQEIRGDAASQETI